MDGIFITDFGKKACIFNTYFAKQCNIFDNGSVIPGINYRTDNRIMDITFSSSDLSKIIKELNPNKAHGHDGIFINMIQICGDSIIPPLKIDLRVSCKNWNFSGFLEKKET